VEFEVDAATAADRFHQYQEAACRGMQASNLLRADKAQVSAAYLPFWVFSCSVTSEFKATLGFKDTSSGELVWKDMEDWRTLATKEDLNFKQLPALQVYASYTLERALAEGAKLRDLQALEASRGVSEEEAKKGMATAGFGQGQAFDSPQHSRDHGQEAQKGLGPRFVGKEVALHSPDMRQHIAWQLAYRGMMHAKIAEAGHRAKAESKAAEVKNVHVTLQIHSRAAELLFLPAYLAEYQYGTRYKKGTSGVTVPQMFQAVVGGTRTGGIAATTHVSARKAELVTGGAVGTLGLAVGQFASGTLGWEPMFAMGGVESMTAAAVAALLGGMWAQSLPHAQRNLVLEQQVHAEQEFYKQYDALEAKTTAAAIEAASKHMEGESTGFTSSQEGSVADEYMQWLWLDIDWRRWEGDESWSWDAQDRRDAAERIAKSVVSRRLARQRFVQRLIEERDRQDYAADVEAQRAQRWRGRGPASGRSSRGPSEFGQMESARKRSRKDFLGYYRLMGIQEGEVTTETIKAAFKAQAMQAHPDRVMAPGTPPEVQQQAVAKFQKLQVAYDVLRDPEKRRAYDRGQFIQ